jgi:multiple sugar transport system substrate-binding protein
MRSEGRGRRFLRAGAAALLACAVAPALGQGSPDRPPVTVTVTTRAVFQTEEAQALRDAVTAFNRQQRRYRVELFGANYRNQGAWVEQVAESGTLPCLVELDGPFMARFAWPGDLMPLDDFLTPGLRKDILPSILAQGTFDGHLYSLGQFESGVGLWANRRYLRAAGVRIPTVARPWTTREFEDALARLANVPGLSYPLSLALYTNATNEFYAYAFLPLLAGFGGDFIDRSGTGRARGVLDGPASVDAMRHFQAWLRNGWSRRVLDRDDDFETGRTALLWTGHWKYHELRQALGDDLVLLPLPDFGHGIKTGMGSWSWAISSTCPAPEGAWAFLAHLMSVDEVLRVTGLNGAIPARIAARRRSALYGPHAPLEVFAQQLAVGAGVPRPQVPYYSVISDAFSRAVNAIAAGGDVQASLGAAARAIDADIDANHGYSPP